MLPPPAGLPALPSTPSDVGGLEHGLWAGRLTEDPASQAPRRGRLRRWCYVAAGEGGVAVGAAVVDIGVVTVGFAFAQLGDRTLAWERRFPLGRGARVGTVPEEGASAAGRWGTVVLEGDGGLIVDVPTDGGRLTAEVETVRDVTPIVLTTATPAGGWNATQKAAGTVARGRIRVDEGPPHQLGAEAGGWRDWTVGRQDRDTSWRWAAGAGVAADGRRVGLNTSTGMNGTGEGEDVVWWDGEPHRLGVDQLAPVDAEVTRGRWRVRGRGWSLELDPTGVRVEDERLPLITSSYVQPIGRFTGTLPDPSGQAVRVRLSGVAEDHHATW